MEQIVKMNPRSVQILANNALNQRDDALDVLEFVFNAMTEQGAHNNTGHVLRPAWNKVRGILKTNGRL